MTSYPNNQLEDEMLLISQMYSGFYSPLVPKEGEKKSRRGRNKSKVDENGIRGGKRKLTAEQVNLLEMNFGAEHKLECERKDRIAMELGLDPRQVAVWFQNRRARWKIKKIEEEFSNLKSKHESTVVEKCRLESEVLRLKEQLSEAEKEIQRLGDRPSDGSPNSCENPYFLGEFGSEGFENLFYNPENNFIHGMEWVDL